MATDGGAGKAARWGPTEVHFEAALAAAASALEASGGALPESVDYEVHDMI